MVSPGNVRLWENTLYPFDSASMPGPGLGPRAHREQGYNCWSRRICSYNFLVTSAISPEQNEPWGRGGGRQKRKKRRTVCILESFSSRKRTQKMYAKVWQPERQARAGRKALPRALTLEAAEALSYLGPLVPEAATRCAGGGGGSAPAPSPAPAAATVRPGTPFHHGVPCSVYTGSPPYNHPHARTCGYRAKVTVFLAHFAN